MTALIGDESPSRPSSAAARRAIGQQVRQSRSGSTLHDNGPVPMPQMRSLEPLVLDRPRQRSVKYPTVVSNRATIFIVHGSHPLAQDPNCCRTTSRLISTAIAIISRGNQIPIANAASPTYAVPRFPPLEVFRRRPPQGAAPSVNGRHPKTFTLGDIRMAVKGRRRLAAYSSILSPASFCFCCSSASSFRMSWHSASSLAVLSNSR